MAKAKKKSGKGQQGSSPVVAHLKGFTSPALQRDGAALAELFLRGQYDEVERRAQDLVQVHPAWGFGWKLLSGVYAMQRRTDEALASARKAALYLPRDPEVQSNLGTILQDLGQLTAAATAFKRALTLKPDFDAALCNLGNVLKNQGRSSEALAAYAKALRCNPRNESICSNLLLAMHYASDVDARECFRRHREWDERFALPRARLLGPCSNILNPEKKLRIGYVSADFGLHPVGLFLAPILAHHDRSSFQVHGYSDRTAEDALTDQLRRNVDVWRRVVGMNPRDLADLIRQDGIDILVDLAGHTAGNRLVTFAMKPAPVQVSWLGYPDTTGLTAMDYRLTDALADPPGVSDGFASETLVRLPHGFLCYQPPDGAPQVAPPPSLQKGCLTFGSFNFMAKVNDQVIALWAELLRAVPASRLILKSPPLADLETCQRVAKLFSATGIESDRIEYRPATATYEAHLATYHDIDIALDTFPYTGTTTIFEALWMGVPVVTLAGERHVSRVGMSILERLGLQECIAHDRDEYLRAACSLATDLPRLMALRQHLREMVRTSPFADSRLFTADLEREFRRMWQQYCSNLSGAAHGPSVI